MENKKNALLIESMAEKFSRLDKKQINETKKNYAANAYIARTFVAQGKIQQKCFAIGRNSQDIGSVTVFQKTVNTSCVVKSKARKNSY